MKDDETTKTYMRSIQDSRSHVGFLSTMDGDMLSMTIPTDSGLKGLFKRYDEFLSGCVVDPELPLMEIQKRLPDLVFGGFRFSGYQDVHLYFQWKLVHQIHRAMTAILPRSIYVSETNTAIKIVNGAVPESFGEGSNEMHHFINELRTLRNHSSTEQEKQLLCLVPQAQITTTIPERMIKDYRSYVFDGKVYRWTLDDLQKARSVTWIIHPMHWAKCVLHGLPNLDISKQTREDVISTITTIFHLWDPIAYALKHKNTFPDCLHTALQQITKGDYISDQAKKEIDNKLNALKAFLGKENIEAVKTINDIAKQGGIASCQFLKQHYEWENPIRDPLREDYDLSCMGDFVKHVSRNLCELFNNYKTLTEDEWYRRQLQCLQEMDGEQFHTTNDLLSPLHVALFKRDHEYILKLTTMPNFSEMANRPYKENVYPLSIIIENRDIYSLILLIDQLSEESAMKVLKEHEPYATDAEVRSIELALLILSKNPNTDTIGSSWTHYRFHPIKGLANLTPFHFALLFGKVDWIKEIYDCKLIKKLPPLFDNADLTPLSITYLLNNYDPSGRYAHIAHFLLSAIPHHWEKQGPEIYEFSRVSVEKYGTPEQIALFRSVQPEYQTESK